MDKTTFLTFIVSFGSVFLLLSVILLVAFICAVGRSTRRSVMLLGIRVNYTKIMVFALFIFVLVVGIAIASMGLIIGAPSKSSIDLMENSL